MSFRTKPKKLCTVFHVTILSERQLLCSVELENVYDWLIGKNDEGGGSGYIYDSVRKAS
jgi:hypothetical protein